MSNYTKLLYILTVIVIILFLSTLTSKKDYDCGDFRTQPDAQKKFEDNKKDIYKLDRDKDKIACESLTK
jgi:hypothetical protein